MKLNFSKHVTVKHKDMFGWVKIGRMKNRERKIGWKMVYFTV